MVSIWNLNLITIQSWTSVQLNGTNKTYFDLKIIWLWMNNFSSLAHENVTHLQYCAKVMRAKCANFVLCLRVFSKKIRPKIRASFRKVLSVISLKERTQIRRIFETRTKIPYHRNNSDCRMRNIAVQWADQSNNCNVQFSCEQSRSRSRFTPRCCLCVNSSFIAKNFNCLIVFNDTNSQT